MNKILRPFALLGLLGALTLPAFAGGPRGADGLQRHMQQLDLTTEQRAELSALRESRAPELRQARIEVRKADRALSDAIESDADKSAIADLAIARHEAKLGAQEVNQSLRADLRAVLTEEQVAQLQDRRKSRGYKKGPRGDRGSDGMRRGPRGR
ncbi:MAG: periplasmic heavy metal sensor [Deltaproteobacteria bacterium]|nr:MAG: periplasmic heavy metal sensor [Deltaproteobacteria bacterium]